MGWMPVTRWSTSGVFLERSFWVIFTWKKFSSHPPGLLYIVRQSTASGDSQLHCRRALRIQTETLMNGLRAWKYRYMLRAVLQNGAKATANHPSSHSLNTAGPLWIFLMAGATNSCLTARQAQPNIGNSRRRILQELSLTMLPYAALSYQILGFSISSTVLIELSEKRPGQALPLPHPK